MEQKKNPAEHFADWFEAKANSPLALKAKERGFNVWHSGGGCHHFRKDTSDERFYVLVCHESEIPDTDPHEWTIGLYSNDESSDGTFLLLAYKKDCDLTGALDLAIHFLAESELPEAGEGIGG